MKLSEIVAASSWFVVVPDRDESKWIMSKLQESVGDLAVVEHASGRPWILGRWKDDELLLREDGTRHGVRVALMGEYPGNEATKDIVQRAVQNGQGIDRIDLRLRGSFHLIASVGNEVRAQGTASGFRRLYYNRTGKIRFVGSRADVVAWLSNSEMSEERLLLRLLNYVPWPFSAQPVWAGVRGVPPGSYIRLASDGSVRETAWWSPPPPRASLREGALTLRSELAAAVELRTAPGTGVSADLAGLDSTALCSILSETAGSVHALTVEGADPRNDDLHWAELTASALPELKHVVIGTDQAPTMFDGLISGAYDFDGPCSMVINRSAFLATVTRSLSHGSALHFSGFGGDELLIRSPAHLHRLMRNNPAVAFRLAREFSARYSWPLIRMARLLAASESYADWLRGASGRLLDQHFGPSYPMLGWDLPLCMPDWFMPEAARTVSRFIRQVAENASPLSTDQGLHSTMHHIISGAAVAREFQLISERAGLRLAVPYYDDRVMEACLAVRPEDVLTPRRYKPLLVEAMKGVMPAKALSRSTKGGANQEYAMGLERNQDQIMTLIEESKLVQLGLIDARKLRQASMVSTPNPLLVNTIGVECWLRSL
ncbi:putative lasso peptide modification enzyme [Planomonospora sphaerica]|uniref:asparagine synthase (glutamine-hydrolyzing) n=1 Tax=Planomonospora sphaerica TaxID=161355 RepID=A0A171DJY6_9ACTN|nr:asparagine synthase-related protein [Planomonospora sphaerica]GAT69129.2 putative lasso peptide modification enzyme [Planomonospora sphaerica]